MARLAVAHGARVVPATTQGIGFARTAGFDAARGDVIVRVLTLIVLPRPTG